MAKRAKQGPTHSDEPISNPYSKQVELENSKGQQLAAQLSENVPQLVTQIPWGHKSRNRRRVTVVKVSMAANVVKPDCGR